MALALTGWIFREHVFPLRGALRLGPGTMLVLGFVEVFLALWLPVFAAEAAARRRIGARAYSAILAIAASLLVVDGIHYDFFRVPLFSAEAMSLAFQGLQEDEVGFHPAMVALALAAVAGFAALLAYAVSALERLLGGIRVRFGARLAFVGVITLAGAVAVIRSSDIETGDSRTVLMEARLIVNLSRRVGSTARMITTDDRAALSPEDARAAVRNLKRRASEALEGEVTARSRPDLVFVHVESLRAGMDTAEVMPFLHALRDRCLALPRHYSTGNATGVGVHGLVGSLDPTLYGAVRSAKLRPIPLAVLRKLGYRQSLYVSKPLTWDGIHGRYFEPTLDHHVVVNEGKGKDYPAYEAAMVERFLADRRSGGDRPRFDYLVFYSSHFNYYFPKSHEKFTPVLELGFSIRSGPLASNKLKGSREGLFNRYRNSLHYVDGLLHRIVEGIERETASRETVIVITGDHGEEFWERGRFGHTYGFVNEQTRVPMVVCMRNPPHVRYGVTSHADVFPTLFDAMMVSPSFNGMLHGRSWYGFDERRDAVVVARPDGLAAWIDRDYKLVFKSSGLLFPMEILDPSDRPLPTREIDVAAVKERLARIRESRPRP